MHEKDYSEHLVRVHNFRITPPQPVVQQEKKKKTTFGGVIKSIFKGLWTAGKGIINLITGYMKSQWEKYDEEAGIKKKKQKEVPRVIKKVNQPKKLKKKRVTIEYE